jgi:predicted MFS family arabinose efflux permease
MSPAVLPPPALASRPSRPAPPAQPAPLASTRRARLLGLAIVLGVLGGTVPSGLYGAYQSAWGWSTLAITAAYAAYAVGTTVALLRFGGLSDRHGRRRVALGALALAAGSAGLFLLAEGIGLILVARVVSGAAIAALIAAGAAWLAELLPRGHAVASRWAGAAQMFGLGVGPLLAGGLAQWAGAPLRLPYVAQLVLLAVAAGIVAGLPETVPARDTAPAPGGRRASVPPAARAAFARVVPGVFGAFAVQGFFAALASSFLRVELGIDDPAVIGAVAFVVFAATAAGGVAAGPLGAARALGHGTLALPAALVLAGLALAFPSLALVAGSALVGGLAVGLIFGGALGEVNAATPPERRGEANAMLLLVVYTAISIPALGVGLATEVMSFEAATTLFLGVVAVLAVASRCSSAGAPWGGDPVPARPGGGTPA